MNQKDLEAADDWMMGFIGDYLLIEDSGEEQGEVWYLTYNSSTQRNVTFKVKVHNGKVQEVRRSGRRVYRAEN